MLKLNQGYNMDCIEGMMQMDTDSVDVILTDPPYCSGGVAESSRSAAKNQGTRSETLARFKWFTGDNMTTQGYAWLMRMLAVQGKRVIKDTGSLLVFTDWRMIPTLAPAIESAGFRYQNMIVWDKGHFGMGQGFRMQHEIILHFTAGSPMYQSASFGNVLTHSRVPSAKRRHPTEKPVNLIKELLEVVTPPGGIVLDPFLGGGTTAEACIDMGFDYIGFELGEDHYRAMQAGYITSPARQNYSLDNTIAIQYLDKQGEKLCKITGLSRATFSKTGQNGSAHQTYRR